MRQFLVKHFDCYYLKRGTVEYTWCCYLRSMFISDSKVSMSKSWSEYFYYRRNIGVIGISFSHIGPMGQIRYHLQV